MMSDPIDPQTRIRSRRAHSGRPASSCLVSWLVTGLLASGLFVMLPSSAVRAATPQEGSTSMASASKDPAAVVLGEAPASAGSALLSWNNPAGGAASTPGNWSPAQVPSAADDLRFGINGNYTVTFNSSVPTSHSHSYEDGSVTLNVTSPHLVSGITVEGAPLDFTTTTLTTGTLRSNLPIRLAQSIGTTGRLDVNDDDADLMGNSSSSDLVVAGNGIGFLNVTGGGLVDIFGHLFSGSFSSSLAGVTVSGIDSLAQAASTLVVRGVGTSIVGDQGDVTMNVSDGAFVSLSGSLAIARRSTSTSTLTIAGAGILDARVAAVNEVEIGHNPAPGFGAGIATVNVNTDGSLLSGGAIRIGGDPDGGTGLLHLEGDGSVVGGSVIVGTGGSIEMDGGRLGGIGTPLDIGTGATLSGFGTIDADVQNLGTITATGTGLTFRGDVVGVGQGMGGIRMIFVQGGTFAGSGVLNTAVFGDPLSSFTATNHLTLGDPASSAGVDLEGGLATLDRTVTLRDFDEATLAGAVTMAGGTLLAPKGILLQDGGSIAGSGTVACDFEGEEGSSIVAGGSLTIGDVADANGFLTEGSIDVGAHTVTLLDADLARAASTSLAGGTLVANAILNIHGVESSLTGVGTIAAPELHMDGILDPGSPIGTIHVSGDYRHGAGGTYSVQLGPAGSAQGSDEGRGASRGGSGVICDRLDVSGEALLHGTLRIGRLPGTEIAHGDSFAIVTASERRDSFQEVQFEDPELADLIDIVYTSTAVYLVVAATSGVDPNDPEAGPGTVAPDRFALRLAGPNPFRAESGTAFEYDVPRSGEPVAIDLFDARGRRVAQLLRGPRPAGTHRLEWRDESVGALASGTYFVRLESGTFGETRRVVLLR